MCYFVFDDDVSIFVCWIFRIAIVEFELKPLKHVNSVIIMFNLDAYDLLKIMFTVL